MTLNEQKPGILTSLPALRILVIESMTAFNACRDSSLERSEIFAMEATRRCLVTEVSPFKGPLRGFGEEEFFFISKGILL